MGGRDPVGAAQGARAREIKRLTEEQSRDDRGWRISGSPQSSESDDFEEYGNSTYADDADIGAGGADDADARADVEIEFAEAARLNRKEAERGVSDYGTARSGRRQRRQILFRRHLERLTIIDPFATSVVAMRWLDAPRLTIPQIAELVGRAKSTIDGDIRAMFPRLLLLERFPPPDPALTYRAARDVGLSRGAAGFAFWFSYTLSAERAAELSGYGRTGATKARKQVLAKIASAGPSDPRLSDWSVALAKQATAPNAIQARVLAGASARLASTMLGKRRSALHPKVLEGQRPMPVLWIEEGNDDEPNEELERLLNTPFDFDELNQRALERSELLDVDPVAYLANALETEPANVFTIAFELVQRDLPYGDAFR